MRWILVMIVAGAALANEQAETALNQFHRAMQQGDSKQMLSLLHDNARIYESGHAESKAEYTEHHLAADIEYAKAVKSTVKKSAVQCEPTMCLITRETETTGEFKAKPVHSITIESAVLVLHDKQWKIRHLHWSSRKAH